MKCQSNCSTYCKKTFKKHQTKYIWVEENGKQVLKECCENCFWLLKQRAKQPGNGGNPTGRGGKKNVGRPQSGDHKLKLKGLIQPLRKLLQAKTNKKVGNST